MHLEAGLRASESNDNISVIKRNFLMLNAVDGLQKSAHKSLSWCVGGGGGGVLAPPIPPGTAAVLDACLGVVRHAVPAAHMGSFDGGAAAAAAAGKKQKHVFSPVTVTFHTQRELYLRA
jgi:hypothetical protein